MQADHPGSGISHHDPDFFPHIRLVAVNSASAAGGLVLLERAAIEAVVRILQEGRAGTAYCAAARAMMSPAVDADHGRYGFTLPPHSALSFSPA